MSRFKLWINLLHLIYYIRLNETFCVPYYTGYTSPPVIYKNYSFLETVSYRCAEGGYLSDELNPVTRMVCQDNTNRVTYDWDRVPTPCYRRCVLPPVLNAFTQDTGDYTINQQVTYSCASTYYKSEPAFENAAIATCQSYGAFSGLPCCRARPSDLEIEKCPSQNGVLKYRLSDNDVTTCVDVGAHMNGASWSRVWPTHSECGSNPEVEITHSNSFNDRTRSLLFVGVEQADVRFRKRCPSINNETSGPMLTVQTFQCDCASHSYCKIRLRAYYYGGSPSNRKGVAMLCEIALKSPTG